MPDPRSKEAPESIESEGGTSGAPSGEGGGEGKRAAIYLRISTRDGRQTEENQRRELRKFLRR
jgi:hypothetical protein